MAYRITLTNGDWDRSDLVFDIKDDTDVMDNVVTHADAADFSLLFGVDICMESLETGCIVRSGTIDWDYLDYGDPVVVGIEWEH